jgi:hypothetical protein
MKFVFYEEILGGLKMIIGDFLKTLNRLPQDEVIKNVSLNGDSDRGCYEDFCLSEDLGNSVVVKDLVEFINSKVINNTFTGYKGGEFKMFEYSIIKYGYPDGGGHDIEGIIIDEEEIKIKKQHILYY